MTLSKAYGGGGGGGAFPSDPTISDFSNAVHDHVDPAGGGVLSHLALIEVGVNTHAQIDAHIAALSAHGVTGNIVGTSGAQTLIDKTLSVPTIAAFTNAGHDHSDAAGGGTIAHADLTDSGADSHATIDSHIAGTVEHGATGAVVGETNTQTLTNKTLTIPTIADFTNAGHDHSDAAGGGTIAHADLTDSGADSHAMIDSHLAATAAHGATGAVVGTTNVQALTNKTLTIPTIADFTNAQHDHSNAAGGGEIPSRFSMQFYGEDLGGGVTSVELMEENTDIGIPLVRAMRTARVAVKFLRISGAAPGDWTLRLFKNGIEVATFAVATT